MSALVIGVGNDFRRDDGIGPAVAAEIARRGLLGVEVQTAAGDPIELLDAWDGVALCVIVDAAVGDGVEPGRIRRWSPGDWRADAAVSSHTLDVPATYALGEALGRLPRKLLVVTVDAADVGHGIGLSPALADAVPAVTSAVLAEIERSAGIPTA
ncbi:hydrogenase maturation protease [Mycolicibacterium iranicum]|uniref:Hydrogenase maturation protease n=1 Tax=Mycolicibacterium iranicum TaxID=912594 RepID=A0ABT4HL11_MYCIR|nr:hydrogenase maturation protease [Mycolicibacterium iranicum]MCZ0730891.1 hydrogenase maturation protease [Mycolicibacterium iranicum]